MAGTVHIHVEGDVDIVDGVVVRERIEAMVAAWNGRTYKTGVAKERAGVVTYMRAFGGEFREAAPDAWAAILDIAELIERGDHDPEGA